MKPRVSLTFFLVSLLLIMWGCESLKFSRPVIPIREYERMIIGRLDANYVGTANCLKACHYHDKIRRDFDASTMGAQLSEKSGLPLVDCESCHGPGSLAIEGLTEERVQKDAEAGMQTACNYETFLDFATLPAPAVGLVCLKCHTANATFNLHDWNAGTHNQNDVSCSDCHDVHAGPDLKVEPRDTARMCFKCHPEQKAQFMLASRHPVMERRIFCTNCHNGHGSPYDYQLREASVKDVCTKCHGDKEGPFLYEHAENTDDCSRCHSPHGSVNNNLLSVAQPFLCLQCHFGHRLSTGTPSTKGEFFTRCTDCHSTIHGTDIPSAGGGGRFTQ